MREIKFKFLMENGEITDTYYLKELIDSDSYINIECEYSSKIKQELQYTGLKDINNKEIYEDDIVIEKSYPFFGNAPEVTNSNQECDELNYVGVVTWDDGYYLDLKTVSDRVRGLAIGNTLYDYENLEVIGNIYENPELLKEEQNEYSKRF